MDSQPKKSRSKVDKNKANRLRKLPTSKKDEAKNSSPVCYLDEEEIRPEYKDQ